MPSNVVKLFTFDFTSIFSVFARDGLNWLKGEGIPRDQTSRDFGKLIPIAQTFDAVVVIT